MENPSNKELFSFIDLTSLNPNDSSASIDEFVNKAISYYDNNYKVAAVCVYPNFGRLVSTKLANTTINTAVVAACFPASQSFLEVKTRECELAVKNGAQEVDIVINIGELLEGNTKEVVDEIRKIKNVIGKASLKVIIESGLLKDLEIIKKATQLSIEGGADFIKTSTGKVDVGATPEAAIAMCEIIKTHQSKTGQKVGIKISGGVRSRADALVYYNIVKKYLGEEFLTQKYFRIGASSLAKVLLTN